MDPLWLLKGNADAPGWIQLEVESRAEQIDVIMFDRDAWALMYAAEPPTKYEGLTPQAPPDGVYLDNHGRPCYVAERREVHSARAVIKVLGVEAEEMMKKVGDPVIALDRLGRSY